MYTREGLMRSATQGWRRAGVVVALGALGCAAGGASASTLSYVASGGAYQAKATFNFSGSTLSVALTNQSQDSAALPWLTGLVFDLTKGGQSVALSKSMITSVSAGGSTVWLGGDPNQAGTPAWSPGQLWGFKNSIQGYTNALSCVGASLFNGSDTIFGPYPGNNLDGSGGAILSALETGFNGHNWSANSGNPNSANIFYQDTLTFTFDLSSIGLPQGDWGLGDVDFRWGSGFENQQLVVVPIPAPALLAGLGLIGVVAARRRFTRN